MLLELKSIFVINMFCFGFFIFNDKDIYIKEIFLIVWIFLVVVVFIVSIDFYKLGVAVYDSTFGFFSGLIF